MIEKATETLEEAVRNYILELQKRCGFFDEEEINNTPKRIAKFWREWSRNRKYNFTVFDNVENYNQMVILKVPHFYSMCSHHLLPFFGSVVVAYIPANKICGISKLARLVRKCASKPQVQENMTQQILTELKEKLMTEDVMVVVRARHLCMEMRGVRAPAPEMITSAISGAFKEQKTRAELMSLAD